MIGIEGIPMIEEGDDLTSIILDASQGCGVELLAVSYTHLTLPTICSV